MKGVCVGSILCRSDWSPLIVRCRALRKNPPRAWFDLSVLVSTLASFISPQSSTTYCNRGNRAGSQYATTYISARCMHYGYIKSARTKRPKCADARSLSSARAIALVLWSSSSAAACGPSYFSNGWPPRCPLTRGSVIPARAAHTTVWLQTMHDAGRRRSRDTNTSFGSCELALVSPHSEPVRAPVDCPVGPRDVPRIRREIRWICDVRSGGDAVVPLA